MRTINPHFVGAPARMSDGRLFTEYRPSCDLLLPLGPQVWAEYDRRRTMQKYGTTQMGTDRHLLVMRGGVDGCVDTMVPEFKKRIYDWQGGREGVAQMAGIGTGRLYLPERADLITADPDVVADATCAWFSSGAPGTFQPYVSVPMKDSPAKPRVPPRYNRYSAPYGN